MCKPIAIKNIPKKPTMTAGHDKHHPSHRGIPNNKPLVGMVSYRVHITDQRLFGQYLVPLRGHFRQRLTTCGFGQCLTLKTLLQSRSRPSCAPTPLPSLLGGIQPGVCSSGDVVQTDYPIIQNRIYVLQIPLFWFQSPFSPTKSPSCLFRTTRAAVKI